MTRTLSISEFREQIGQFVSRVSKRMSRCVITRKGAPEAVLISHAEYESWNATLETVSNKEEMESIERGLAELNAGDSFSFEEVFGEPLNGSDSQAGKVFPQRS